MSWRRGEKPSRRRWARVRLTALDRDGWACVKCGKAGGWKLTIGCPWKTAARCPTWPTFRAYAGAVTLPRQAVNVGAGRHRPKSRSGDGI